MPDTWLIIYFFYIRHFHNFRHFDNICHIDDICYIHHICHIYLIRHIRHIIRHIHILVLDTYMQINCIEYMKNYPLTFLFCHSSQLSSLLFALQPF